MVLFLVAFCPIHDYSIFYVGETYKKRFSAAVMLPKSYYSKEYQLRGGDGGNALEIKVAWPAKLLS